MAMSYGKAVLVSDIPGMLEVVHDGETGFVFRSGDMDNLALRINMLFANPKEVEEVAKCGQRLMAKEYDWEVIGRKTKVVYEFLAN